MKRTMILLITMTLFLSMILPSCAPRTPYQDTYSSTGDTWYMGFGSVEIPLPTDSESPLYIAGYHGGREIEGMLDLPRANAVWMDTGSSGILLIGIDCVGLGSGTVAEIRNRLQDFCPDTGCVSVNVYATHTHAGLDTLGLWGPAAVDGKNPDYMENLIASAVSAAEEAYGNRSAGTLRYGSAIPEDLLYDSREPDYMNMKIIELSRERCDRLNELLENDDILVVNGDGRDTSLLIDEGIKDVQAFVALTQETETNILACLAAKRLGVRKTVALVENLDYVSMAERLDIGTIINKKMIAASHIYKMMLDTDVANVKCLTIAKADVAEFIAAEGSMVTQVPVHQLNLPTGVNLGGLVRDGVGYAIDGNTQIQPGDCVVVFSLSTIIKKLDRYFGRPTSSISRFISSLSHS